VEGGRGVGVFCRMGGGGECSGSRRSGGTEGGGDGVETYISGSFCASMMAAMGMPKLEAGPQKSVARACILSVCSELGAGMARLRWLAYGSSRGSRRLGSSGFWR